MQPVVAIPQPSASSSTPVSDLDQRTRAILEAADSPTHVEADPRLDWPDLWARVEDLGVTLAKIAGRAFELDRNVQDATFLTDLSIVRRIKTATWTETVEEPVPPCRVGEHWIFPGVWRAEGFAGHVLEACCASRLHQRFDHFV